MRMKKSATGLLIGLVSGVLLSFMFVKPYEKDILLSNLILQLSGSYGDFVISANPLSMLSLFIRLIPDYVFMLLYGTFIYQHYCTAGVYIFSRILNRRRWFYKESGELLLHSICYVVVQTICVLLTSGIRWNIQIDEAGFLIILCWVILNSLWTFFWTMLINCVAIWTGGSEHGAVTAFAMQVISFMIIGTLDFLQRTLQWMTTEEMQQWLPVSLISHMIMAWHTASTSWCKDILHEIISTSLVESMLLLLGLSLILTGVTGYILQNQDILGTNGEGK